MRWIIWYIRSLFCKHEFTYDECYVKHYSSNGGRTEGMKASATCNKCGYHRNYWKFT